MSKRKAPDGAFLSVGQQPAIYQTVQQQSAPHSASEADYGSTAHIARMIRQVLPNETRIKAWKEMSKSKGVRITRTGPATKPAATSYGDMLRDALKRRDLNQTEFASIVGLSSASISGYVRGRSFPTPAKAAILENEFPELKTFSTPVVKVELKQNSALVGDSISDARQQRDEHISNLRQLFDYHANTLAYEDVPCGECRLPSDPLEFTVALITFEEPATQCTACLGRGVVRSKRTDPESIADAKLVSYWSKNLDDFIRCSKIRAATPGANQAYIELETSNRYLLNKFGNENQTALEGDDAVQAARQGLVDAALRFDLLKQRNGKYCCAVFNTVAYNWCRRNTRARHTGWKRAGLYAPSIEGMRFAEEEGVGAIAQITASDGTLGTFDAPSSSPPSLALDLREKVGDLPELQRSLVRAEMAGLSTGQIAKQLDITTSKVRAQRAAAYETLRETMGAYASVLHD